MGIKQSAHKHGITDSEIHHALRNPIQVTDKDDYVFIIGTSPSGALIELCINSDGDVFHAMKARKSKMR